MARGPRGRVNSCEVVSTFPLQRLYISENTVKSHVRNVYQKLGVHSKQDIIDIINADDATSLGAIPREGE